MGGRLSRCPFPLLGWPFCARSWRFVVAASYAWAGSPTLHWPSQTLTEGITMNAIRIVGIVLIVGGLIGFFTGGFNFTKESTAAKIGPLELTVKEKESVNIPQWLSIGAAVAGALMLVAGTRKS
jgi:drug/metabolite transporter (DMT)-like permease